MKKILLLLPALWLTAGTTLFAAAPKFADIFNSGMVLQRDKPVRVWGTADPGAQVKVSLFLSEAAATADKEGRWSAELPKMKAGGPFKMTVAAGSDKTALDDILVGEVWFAGGQSNMAFALKSCKDKDKAIAEAKNPYLRVASLPAIPYPGAQPLEAIEWRALSPEFAGEVSAVAYYFAKELQETLGVPVGLVCLYKGGTPAEVWMSREKLLFDPVTAPIVSNYDEYMKTTGDAEYARRYAGYEAWNKQYQADGRKGRALPEPMGPRNLLRPAGLYDNVLRVAPMSLGGVIWYQGEANAARAAQYVTLFPNLIADWRDVFRDPEMPFYFVQLPEFERETFPELRWAQFQSWQNTPNTGMAVAMGYGDPKNIHPADKAPVGHRLALIALAKNYEIEVPFSGPAYKDSKIDGNKVILSFDYLCDGLAAGDGKPLRGFTICGKDGKFIPAQARIEGETVVVWSDKAAAPAAVRYNWAPVPNGNLTNSAGLPASPFRTDHFKLDTEGVLHVNYK